MERIKAAGPMRGLFTIIDTPIGEPDDEHAVQMERYARRMGIPDQNLRIGHHDPFTGGEKDTHVLEETLVYAAPNLRLLHLSTRSIERINRYNHHLLVMAAGNTQFFGHRRIWYPNDRHWQENPGRWGNAMEAFATGRVILAKHAALNSDGEVIVHEPNVMCGLAKEYCYSIISRSGDYISTSAASVNLGALTFYLSQLWDTPQEVVGVLNTCAEDVGEPGIDEEFGRGIVSVVCDTVQNRERTVVADSMTVSGASPASPVMAHMTSPQSPSTGFRPFYALHGYSRATATGYLGGQFSSGGTDFFVSGGAGYAPLGVYSSLLRGSRKPFMEFGSKRSLFSRGGHTVSLLGAYGYGGGSGLSAHTGHLGAQYERRFIVGMLSLSAGYRELRGRVGIPGHRRANAEPVLYHDGSPEMNVSFALGL